MDLTIINRIIDELNNDINERKSILLFLSVKKYFLEHHDKINNIMFYIKFFYKQLSNATQYKILNNFLLAMTKTNINEQLKKQILFQSIVVELNNCSYKNIRLLNKYSLQTITHKIQICDYDYISNINYNVLLREVKKEPIKHFNIERLVLGWTNAQFKEYAIEQSKNYDYFKEAPQHKKRNEFIDIIVVSRHFYGKPSGQLLKLFFNYKDIIKNIRFTLIQLGSFRDDDTHKNLKNHAYKFYNFNFKEECIDCIKKSQPDIIIEVMGLMNNHLLDIISLRLAPIQISWLAYPGTCGMESIDYIISDKYVIPNDQRIHYCEKVLEMPECYQINDDLIEISENYTIPKMEEIKKNFTIIGFMNHTYKVDIQTINIWCQAFKKCKDTKFLMINMNNTSIGNILNYCKKHYGIERDFFIILPAINKNNHLARIHKYTDFCIDSIICNGHTTTTDILLTGTPLLTMTTPTFSGQVSESLLKNIHCDELVSYNKEDYINNIVNMANNHEYREKMIEKVHYSIRKHNILNSRRYCQHLVEGIIMAYNLNQNKQHIDIPMIEEYFTLNDNSVRSFKIPNKYSTLKIIFGDDELELLMYKHELWKNKKLTYHDIDIYKEVVFSLKENGDLLDVYLNSNIVGSIRKELNKIKCNNDFII